MKQKTYCLDGIAKKNITIEDKRYIWVYKKLNLRLNNNIEFRYAQRQYTKGIAEIYEISTNEKICTVFNAIDSKYSFSVNEESFIECDDRKKIVFELFEKAYEKERNNLVSLIENELRISEHLVYNTASIRELVEQIDIPSFQKIPSIVENILTIYKTIDKDSRLYRRMTNYFLPEIEIMLENALECYEEWKKLENDSIEGISLADTMQLYFETIMELESWLNSKDMREEELERENDDAELICDTFNSILSLDGLTNHNDGLSA